MKLATLLLLGASLSARGQTNVVPGDTSRGATNSTPAVVQVQTNQLRSAVELGEEVRAACLKGRRSICGRILRVLPGGMVVESGYTNLLREPLTQSWLVPGATTASLATNFVESNETESVCVGLVFLTDLPKARGPKPRQYDYVILRGFPTGQHTYTSVGDVQKTVRRFSASLEHAVKLNYEVAEKKSQASPAGTK